MILSIESSCDDSSVALSRISDCKILYHKKISQDLEHSKYGGVVPEIASRLHAVSLPRILGDLKAEFGDLGEVKAIAVTNEPGLSVSLIEGVMMAKALAISLNHPLIAVNHLQGHIYSLFLEADSRLPMAILLLSGGHSLILEANSHNSISRIATTLDDSFGEAFDKVAKMLDLGYPGGAAVESCAKNAVQKTLHFPVPLLHSKDLAFSFSGLKNAVRLEIERRSVGILGRDFKNLSLDNAAKAEICYAFQKSAIAHIIHKMRRYLKDSAKNSTQDFMLKRVGIVGGASANLALRSELEALCAEFDKEICFAPLEFCSDNAAMIGRCAIEDFKMGNFADFRDLDISPNSTLF